MNLFFGIVAMTMVGLSWTVFGYLMGKAPKLGIDVTGLLFICTGIEFFISLVIAVFSGIPRATAAGWGIGFGLQVACGVVNYLQLEIMSKAMQRGPNGIVWTIIQSGFVFPFIMGITFFGVPLQMMRGTGFLLVIISLILLGTSGDREPGSSKWKLLALIAFGVTGISQCLSNLPSYFASADAITSIWRTNGFALGVLIGCFIYRFMNLRRFFQVVHRQLFDRQVWRLGVFGSSANLLSSFLFLFPGMNMLAKANAGAIAYPIMVCSCLIFFELYSIIFLHEKRTMVQIGALILCLFGAAGICF